MGINKSERTALIGILRQRARQAEAEAKRREKVLLAEVQDQLTATFKAENQLWKEAVAVVQKAMREANEHIALQIEAMGIPRDEAPGLELSWYDRGSSYANSSRRTEIRKLAETRLAAMTAAAKVTIADRRLDLEEALILGGFESDDAKAMLETMPRADTLMQPLDLDELGARRWVPAIDAATTLTTPSTGEQRQARGSGAALPGGMTGAQWDLLSPDVQVAIERAVSDE